MCHRAALVVVHVRAQRLVEMELPESYNKPKTRTVRALRPKQAAKGTTQIWLHEDDLPWLLKYLATEADEGGLRPKEEIDGPAVAVESEASVETPTKKTRCSSRARWGRSSGKGP